MGKVELLYNGMTKNCNKDIIEYFRLLNIKYEINHACIMVDFDDIIHILTCSDNF